MSIRACCALPSKRSRCIERPNALPPATLAVSRQWHDGSRGRRSGSTWPPVGGDTPDRVGGERRRRRVFGPEKAGHGLGERKTGIRERGSQDCIAERGVAEVASATGFRALHSRTSHRASRISAARGGRDTQRSHSSCCRAKTSGGRRAGPAIRGPGAQRGQGSALRGGRLLTAAAVPAAGFWPDPRSGRSRASGNSWRGVCAAGRLRWQALFSRRDYRGARRCRV